MEIVHTIFTSQVAPRTGAWIETHSLMNLKALPMVAPRTGAWIETILRELQAKRRNVAPRTGAWIETYTPALI